MGHWSANLHRQLAWVPVGKSRRTDNMIKGLPSWSWASCCGPVDSLASQWDTVIGNAIRMDVKSKELVLAKPSLKQIMTLKRLSPEAEAPFDFGFPLARPQFSIEFDFNFAPSGAGGKVVARLAFDEDEEFSQGQRLYCLRLLGFNKPGTYIILVLRAVDNAKDVYESVGIGEVICQEEEFFKNEDEKDEIRIR
ncbi:hypothetical protein EJ08DRAFT_388924 [Tothia fuscella]|uniref:Uncharacterized protein n=1 Tax=Tothia fuscella TaxID=1048955 RepID=A0A9P4P0M3_9PEZI|nr:hypothetical protein EJ08DRAFT_388924 [Tothia fuscella]